ncbi:MAG: hypothetical protein C0508_00270 [Cyanobacteria bacterium PR.023]|nr:hypothetical protein [Cyanobacteria bacterium PR.023]
MPQAKRAYPGEVRTRLTTDDLKRFKLLAEAKKLGDAELARQMIVEALDRGDQGIRNRIESEYAQQLRASTEEITGTIKAGVNRICGLLAKVAVTALASNKFLARLEDTDALMKDCTGAAAQQVRDGLTDDEAAAMQGMKKKVEGV